MIGSLRGWGCQFREFLTKEVYGQNLRWSVGWFNMDNRPHYESEAGYGTDTSPLHFKQPVCRTFHNGIERSYSLLLQHYIFVRRRISLPYPCPAWRPCRKSSLFALENTLQTNQVEIFLEPS